MPGLSRVWVLSRNLHVSKTVSFGGVSSVGTLLAEQHFLKCNLKSQFKNKSKYLCSIQSTSSVIQCQHFSLFCSQLSFPVSVTHSHAYNPWKLKAYILPFLSLAKRQTMPLSFNNTKALAKGTQIAPSWLRLGYAHVPDPVSVVSMSMETMKFSNRSK